MVGGVTGKPRLVEKVNSSGYLKPQEARGAKVFRGTAGHREVKRVAYQYYQSKQQIIVRTYDRLLILIARVYK